MLTRSGELPVSDGPSTRPSGAVTVSTRSVEPVGTPSATNWASAPTCSGVGVKANSRVSPAASSEPAALKIGSPSVDPS